MAWSLVQSAVAGNAYVTTVTVTFAQPTQQGDMLVLVIGEDSGNPTWTLPSGWAQAGSYSGSGPWIFYYENNPGGIISVTLTASVQAYCGVVLMEFAGFGVGVFDAAARKASTGGSPTALTVTGGADANANDLVVAGFAMNSLGGGQTFAPQAGFTSLSRNYANGTSTIAVEYGAVSAAGAQTATATATGITDYTAVIATFKIGSVPPTTEQYHDSDQANSATYSTLNGAINNSTETIAVRSTAPYSSQPTFRIRIDNEILLVYGVGTGVLNAHRGQEGTAAAAHNDATPVYQVLTAGAVDALLAKGQMFDVYNNLPAAATPGRLFRDKAYPLMWRDNGGGWDPFGLIYPFRLPPPISGGSGWTWVNQGAVTVDESHGPPYFQQPAGSGADNLHALVRAVPTAPYAFKVAILPNFPRSQYVNMGLCLNDSVSGKIATFGVRFDPTYNTPQLIYDKWTNFTTFTANYGSADFFLPPVVWLEIIDDGTNRTYLFSADGLHFIQMNQVGNTDFLTPNRIGIYMDQNGAQFPAGMALLSWAGVS